MQMTFKWIYRIIIHDTGAFVKEKKGQEKPYIENIPMYGLWLPPKALLTENPW